MINCANMFAGNDNPAFKMGTNMSEKLTETAFNTVSAIADNVLKFNQTLFKCKNPQEAFGAASNLAQENTAAAITAIQKSCSAMLETFSDIGNQCASALDSTAETFGNITPAAMRPAKAKRAHD